MKLLFAGQVTPEYLADLITLARLESDNVKAALNDHLCHGWPAGVAASKNSVQESNMSRAINRLEEVAALFERMKERAFYHLDDKKAHASAQPEFEVLAGKYESGYSDDENIKYASGPVSIDRAIELAAEYSGYPFCFIEYHGHRLGLN